MIRPALLLALCLAALPARAALDLDALWDFERPAVSEQRFREALAKAQGDDALVLRTQIARTLGLRRQYDAALRELDAIEAQAADAGPEVRVRLLLERGRTLRSSGRPEAAEPLFQRAFELADRTFFEFLAADALHMIALVQTDTAGKLGWNRRVVDYARGARDWRARRWDAAALNNMGVTLNEAGRHDEALAVLRDALQAYERSGTVRNVRYARWMVAYTQRLLKRTDDAIAAQRALEAEWAADGEVDPYVFDELSQLWAIKGDHDRATHYRALYEITR